MSCHWWAKLTSAGQRDDQANRTTNNEIDQLAKGIERSQSIKV